MRGFIDQIFMEPTKIMIVGADCSTSTEPVAELAPFWNLVQVSRCVCVCMCVCVCGYIHIVQVREDVILLAVIEFG